MVELFPELFPKRSDALAVLRPKSGKKNKSTAVSSHSLSSTGKVVFRWSIFFGKGQSNLCLARVGRVWALRPFGILTHLLEHLLRPVCIPDIAFQYHRSTFMCIVHARRQYLGRKWSPMIVWVFSHGGQRFFLNEAQRLDVATNLRKKISVSLGDAHTRRRRSHI